MDMLSDKMWKGNKNSGCVTMWITDEQWEREKTMEDSSVVKEHWQQ